MTIACWPALVGLVYGTSVSAWLSLWTGLAVLFALRSFAQTAPGTLANRLTLSRLLAATMLLGSVSGTWSVSLWTIGLIAFALDGLDGWVARRQKCCTDFGARFDMETDAFFILVLSVLVWRHTTIGAWILAIGAARYAFVFASKWVPALDAPLRESLFRKFVCVVQVAGLLWALAPLGGARFSEFFCSAALALLVISFARDCWTLLRRASPSQGELPAV